MDDKTPELMKTKLVKELLASLAKPSGNTSGDLKVTILDAGKTKLKPTMKLVVNKGKTKGIK